MTVDGIRFDSQKEAKRYQELLIMQKAGLIRGLERQKRFLLIPSQRIGKKVVERECVYVADFVYLKEDKVIVEDVKGYKGGGAYQVFTIKRKLMLQKYGIRVIEI